MLETKSNFLILDKHRIRLDKITGFVDITEVLETGVKKDGEEVKVTVYRFCIFFDGTKVDFYFKDRDEAYKFQTDVYEKFGF